MSDRLSGGAVFAVLFWYFLLSASVMAKLMSLHQLGVVSILEAMITLAFVLLATRHISRMPVRVCLSLIVITLFVWNMLSVLRVVSVDDCACFGTFSVSRKWLTLVELFSIPWLFVSIGLPAIHWQGMKPRHFIYGQILLSSLLWPWFGLFAPVNPVVLTGVVDGNAAVRFAEAEIQPNLSGFTGNWLVFYYSSDCSNCKLMFSSLVSGLPDDWLILLVNAGNLNGLKGVSDFSGNRAIYFFEPGFQVDLPGVLPQACCIIGDEVVDISTCELAVLWQQTLEAVACIQNERNVNRLGPPLESAFEDGEGGMFYDDYD